MQRATAPDLAVCILGGGEASRFTGKLERTIDGIPLIVRTYRAFRDVAPIYISCKSSFAREIDAQLQAPMIVDRWTRCGPLGGLLSAFAYIHEPRVFVVAGDAPFVDAGVLHALEREWREGIEAVVPVHGDGADERLEPLCALYDRQAFLREGHAVLRHGSGAVRSVVEHLRTRRVRSLNERAFVTVNTPQEYDAVVSTLRAQ